MAHLGADLPYLTAGGPAQPFCSVHSNSAPPGYDLGAGDESMCCVYLWSDFPLSWWKTVQFDAEVYLLVD